MLRPRLPGQSAGVHYNHKSITHGGRPPPPQPDEPSSSSRALASDIRSLPQPNFPASEFWQVKLLAAPLCALRKANSTKTSPSATSACPCRAVNLGIHDSRVNREGRRTLRAVETPLQFDHPDAKQGDRLIEPRMAVWQLHRLLNPENVKIPAALLQRLLEAACYTT
jgi:hypothetical protein